MNPLKFKAPIYFFFILLAIGFTTFSFVNLNNKKVLRHVVCFQFKEDVSEARRKKAVKDFLALKKQIPEILKFEGGDNISIEGHDKGFTHCFVLTFKNEADRNIYLDCEPHIVLANKNKPLLKDLFVVDYWGKE